MRKLAWAGIGCLAVPVVVVAALAGVAGIAWLVGTPEPNVVERVARVERAGLPVTAAPAGREPARAESAAGALAVTIEVEEGSFRIAGGDPEAGVEVEAQFDENNYTLTTSPPSATEPGDDSAAGAVRIAFEPRGWSLARWVSGLDVENQVVVRLPRGVPIDLVVHHRKGELAIEPDGLALRSLVLDAAMGEVRVALAQQNPIPMQRLEIAGRMGDFRLEGLGRLRPREIDVRGRMGDFRLDLGGLDPGHVAIRAAVSFGSLALVLPADARVASVRRQVRFGEWTWRVEGDDAPRERPAPEVEFEGRVTFGEILVRRHDAAPRLR